LPIWNGIGLSRALEAGYNTYGFGSLRPRRTDIGTREFAMGLGDLKGTFYIIRTTTGSWSEAGNTRNRLVSKASMGRPPILTPSFWVWDGLWNWNPKGGKKCKSAPIIILGNRESRLRVKARGIWLQDVRHITKPWAGYKSKRSYYGTKGLILGNRV